jgi:glycogen debranching enzyme
MGAVPHTPYYGTIDATLLFLMLFAETMRLTGDQALFHTLLPAVERALDWIDAYGDVDGDGYVDFQPRSGRGLSIQGWKDSGDSVQYPDGRVAEPPIALVEVQAYVYAAKTAVAATFRQMGGNVERATQLEASAAALREQFNRDFWLPELGFYAQALDGKKQALPELTSNVGHALLGGILTEERARQVGDRLLRPDMASGWGIRTRGSSDPAYNPMSYHNGSVWPHDNSLIIWGMQRSGLREASNTISEQIFAAARHYPRMRLPELMCGFGREDAASEGPAEYPVSCSPQAWAAGTPYLILQSILGLEPDAGSNVLTVDPHLPSWLGRIEVRNLRVGQGRVHFVVSREGVETIASEGIEIRTP